MNTQVDDPHFWVPRLIKNLVIGVFGIVGVTFFLNGNSIVGLADSLVMFGTGIYAGFASFGMMNFIDGIRNYIKKKND